MKETGFVRLEQLEQINLIARRILSDAMCTQSVHADMVRDALFAEMACELRAVVMGRKIEAVHVCYPSDWKEALKERWAPAFFKKLFPVRYVSVSVEAMALYPKMPPPIGQHQPVLFISRTP